MLDAIAIFLQAQQAWIARVVPPYESFHIACDQTFLTSRCGAGDIVAFTVRSSDGRTFAQTLPANGEAGSVLLRGAFITGPAGTPLGFYRALPNGSSPTTPPPNLAADPLQTIATVTAHSHAYDVALAGEENIGGRKCYHLSLVPRADSHRYPLRDLWVEESSFKVVQLTYARPYDERDTWASVRYRFAPIGPSHVWTIVHIEAEAVIHGFLSSRIEKVSDDLTDISFPGSAPESYFVEERS
jgi:MucB/RseB N-terminal domain